MPKTKKIKSKKTPYRAWKAWPFKHMTAFVLMVVAFVLLIDTIIMTTFFEFSRGLGYVGALVAGMLSVSIFTAAPGLIILFELSRELNPFYVILFATLGSILADTAILRIFEDNILGELRLLKSKLGFKKVKLARGQRKRFRLLGRLGGMFIVASPLPDEAGIAMMDVAHLKQRYIVMICAAANLVGISLLVLTSRFAANS